MQKRSWGFAGFAFITGAFAMFLRWVQRLRCFEEETGLYRSGGLSTLFLLLVVVAAAVGLVVIALPLRSSSTERDGTRALRSHSPLPDLISALGGVVMLAGAVLLVFSTGGLTAAFLYRLLALLGVIASVCACVLVYRFAHGKADVLSCLCGACVVLFYCFWMIVSYKDHASDPVLWNYAPEILAIAAGTLGYYFLSGYAFGKAKPFATVLFSGLAFVLSLLSAMDDRPVALSLMLIAPSLLLLLSGWLILSNTRGGKRAKAFSFPI